MPWEKCAAIKRLRNQHISKRDTTFNERLRESLRPPTRRILDGFHVFYLTGLGVARECLSLRNDGGLRKFTRFHHADNPPLETVARALGRGQIFRAASGGVDHHRGPVAADDAQHGAGLAFLETRQAHGGDLMFAAETVAVLDEIEAETAAVAVGIRLVAPCRRPGAVEIGFGGMRGHADEQGRERGGQRENSSVQHDGFPVAASMGPRYGRTGAGSSRRGLATFIEENFLKRAS